MKRLAILCLAVMLLLPGLAQAKIFLADTDDTLRVVTASGVSTIHMYASWADITTSALTPGSSTARVTTATTTVLVAAPAASTQRQIKGLTVRNNHASSSNVITVQFFDGTNATELIQYTLLAGETLEWGEDENFRVIDASGQIKSVVTANAGTNLSTSSLLTTTAHDAAFGTAGSADTQVRTVQGISSMTPLLVNPGTASNFGITSYGSTFPSVGEAAGFTDGTNMVAGRVVTSAPGTSDAGLVVRPISPASSTVGSAVPSVGVQVTGTDGTNARALKTDSSGELQVDVLTLPSNASVNISQMNGVATSMGNGASGTGTQRVTIANDSTGTVAVTQATGTNLHMVCDSGCSSSSGFADNGAFTFGTTSINPIGGVFDDTSSNTATENSAAIARITQNKALHINMRNASGTEIGTSGNPVRVDPTGTTTQPTNVAQINGVTPLMGAGNTGTGSPRVTIATDQAALTGLGVYVEDAAETAGGNLSMSGTVRRDTAASSAGSTGDNATLNTDATGLLWTRTIDPCSSGAKTFLPINISTATTTEITPSLAGASTNYYVCSLMLISAAANNVALVDDDTDNCVSVTSGMAGGTTAASGFNLAANSGLTFGNGMGAVFKTNGTNRVVCLVTSAATQLSGTMTVVAAP